MPPGHFYKQQFMARCDPGTNCLSAPAAGIKRETMAMKSKHQKEGFPGQPSGRQSRLVPTLIIVPLVALVLVLAWRNSRSSRTVASGQGTSIEEKSLLTSNPTGPE